MKTCLDVFVAPDAAIESGVNSGTVRIQCDTVRLVLFTRGTAEERAAVLQRLAAVSLAASHELMQPEVTG
jgi:hypothetical protein